MAVINFMSGGLCGDFIHQMSVVKNICKIYGDKADLYISDCGDSWKFGKIQAYKDLYGIVISQDYINDFRYLEKEFEGDCIDLNDWRKTVATTHAETGRYNKCWSELLSEEYAYRIPDEYKWMKPSINKVQIELLIHRSKHRHNDSFNWIKVLDGRKAVFITTDITEWEQFHYKEFAELKIVSTITEVANNIAACGQFIGNQSAMFAIACAFDVPRICELD